MLKTVEALRGEFRGDIVLPGDDAYDSARALYNGMIDKRPGAIARCRDSADVMAAVRTARERDLLVAVRGGGHNGPGLGSCDDGLVIDLSAMRGVRVDPFNRTVRVSGGCTQGDVDHATHPFGLAVPAGIVASTGVAGLTLGGGHGYLARRYGLTIDNLLEADVVLADGTFVTASEREHPDLFWALRGGGGNFGVVTSFLFRAHPIGPVLAGPMFWDVAHARELMEWYRDYLPKAPREVYAFLGLKRIPFADGFPEDLQGRKVVALIWCYSGPLDQGRQVLESAKQQLPPPLLESVQAMPFRTLQGLFDPLLPSGLQWYWKGAFVRALPDAAIDAHLLHGVNTPTAQSIMHLYPVDGAVGDVPVEATAWGCRDATWSMVIAGIDPDPGQAGRLADWARGYAGDLAPHTESGAYVNFMMEEGEERVRATYGSNWDRLVDIKTQYDPTNFFRVNQNIQPRRTS